MNHTMDGGNMPRNHKHFKKKWENWHITFDVLR